ncbi:hypothetical protein LZ30DRAFT_127303 [Colletotrichum cereale]|nr:hypothetical protein LZ30DRAFT_127303 [Colletotrichum cereale]
MPCTRLALALLCSSLLCSDLLCSLLCLAQLFTSACGKQPYWDCRRRHHASSIVIAVSSLPWAVFGLVWLKRIVLNYSALMGWCTRVLCGSCRLSDDGQRGLRAHRDDPWAAPLLGVVSSSYDATLAGAA